MERLKEICNKLMQMDFHCGVEDVNDLSNRADRLNDYLIEALELIIQELEKNNATNS